MPKTPFSGYRLNARKARTLRGLSGGPLACSEHHACLLHVSWRCKCADSQTRPNSVADQRVSTYSEVNTDRVGATGKRFTAIFAGPLA